MQASAISSIRPKFSSAGNAADMIGTFVCRVSLQDACSRCSAASFDLIDFKPHLSRRKKIRCGKEYGYCRQRCHGK
ncbi:hypothetical cytosolic protein [Syntrophus aciditrophicus SB]|uniref:Hypothetical cytosolic protein n=1 Tax=Syntrophus aciditrophicus (strain SB) TaxID=56780 RepID=Q2LR91_SYNAS|nr:hypothetical cytosolic protein [Syntrophus aciditrophicus SB]